MISGDTVTGLRQSYTSIFATTNLTETVASYAVNDGNAGNNYFGNDGGRHDSGSINRAPLTITALGNSKTYDSTVTAAALPAVSGTLGADTVTGLAEVYTDINAGTAKTLNVARYTVNDGNGGMNYLVSTSANATGLMNRASLTITATTNTKTYDSTTTAAAIPVVSGLMGADSVSGIAEAYRVVNTAIPAVTTLTGLKSPFSLAVDAAGNLYAANYGAGTISVFAPGTTSPNNNTNGPEQSLCLDCLR